MILFLSLLLFLLNLILFVNLIPKLKCCRVSFKSQKCASLSCAVLDRRPKFYGRSRRFNTYGYGYGGRSLRPYLRPKVLFVVFLLFSKIEAKIWHLRINLIKIGCSLIFHQGSKKAAYQPPFWEKN